ncbi:MAG: DUF1800 domain-containing protein [Candidatus Acidiferrum sp.]
MSVQHGPSQQTASILATPRSFLAGILSVACIFSLGIDVPALSAAPSPAKTKKPKKDPALKDLPITELTADQAILHALNRLAYGPRPGDVERIRQMGLAKWIDQQLNPSSIDDRALDARLEDFPTLKMSAANLEEDYPRPKQVEKQASKRAQAQLEQDDQRRSDAAAAIVSRDMMPGASSTAPASTETNQAAPAAQADSADANAPSPMKEEPAQENPVAQNTGKRRQNRGGDANDFARAFGENSNRPQRVIAELAMAKVTRAIYSERQLQQVMDDFWFNHFNVYARKGEDLWYLTSYERDVIQPHALGKFKDLLTATAKSPAMLFYLDNYLSVDPRAAQRLAAERAMRQQMRYERFGQLPPAQAQQKKGNEHGLNENYGRELMELQTLSVDGGYTQKDVTEVARCFTGWTIDKPRLNPEFKFDDRLHDPEPKYVLGKKINAGGMKDGEEVLNLLAHNPNTAKFISTKLARRFVSDNPPPELVARMAKTFEESDGDIKAVMHTMIYSPEFWSREAYQAKIKTPFELVVSTARALGTDVDMPQPLVGWVGRIGEPLYQCQPPTGYADKADAWVNTGALLNRLNFSLALAGNRMRGSRTDVGSLLGVESTADAKAALERAVQVFLDGQAAPTTVETLEKQLDNPQVLQARLDDPVKHVDLGVVAGLVLGAPEFQRR